MSSELSLKSTPDKIDAPDKRGACYDPKENNDEDDFRRELERLHFNEEKIYHYLRIAFIVVTIVSAIAIVGTYLLHLIVAERLRWLSAGDLANIKDMAVTITTGVIVSFGVSQFLGLRKKA